MVRSQGAAAYVPALCGGVDRAGRPQERRPNGRAGRAGRLRPAAPFRIGRGLVRGSAGARACAPGGQARGRRGRLPRHRRHDVAEEGDAFGRGRAAICVGPGQDGQLPNLGVADVGARRGPGDGGPAAVPAGDLDRRRSSARARRRARRISLGADQVGDRARRTRSPDRRRRSLRDGPRRRRVRMGAEFRQALSARSLAWAVGVPRHQKVYPRDVELVFPTAGRGRPRKRHVPNVLSTSAEDMLTQAKWRTLAWRKGAKGPLKARFAAVRVRAADGPPQRIGDKGMQHMPGEEVWLVGERRASGERKYYLANLPADADLKTLAATIKARWVCEQAHQQLKEELGLDHFEGRSWRGLHRHALMAMIAYAFLQHLRLAAASGGKKNLRRPASTDTAGDTESRRRRPGPRTALSMPALQANPPQITRINLPK